MSDIQLTHRIYRKRGRELVSLTSSMLYSRSNSSRNPKNPAIENRKEFRRTKFPVDVVVECRSTRDNRFSTDMWAYYFYCNVGHSIIYLTKF